MTASAGAEACAAPFVRDREYRDEQSESLAAFVDRGEAATASPEDDEGLRESVLVDAESELSDAGGRVP
jgi:hypothetical protein